MGRPSLGPEEVERFRGRLCDLALRRFAEDGYDAVSFRKLARDLGCSYATPYRYFRNKADIFAAVRALAYERLAAALEGAAVGSAGPEEHVRALASGYLRFAIEQPQAYRIMFELSQPDAVEQSEYLPKQLHAWRVFQEGVRRAVAAGVLSGDPSRVGHILWAGLHGLVALHLAGKLVLGVELEDLAPPMIDALLDSQRPGPRT